MAARVRKETTLPIKWIARLQMGTSKSLKLRIRVAFLPETVKLVA